MQASIELIEGRLANADQSRAATATNSRYYTSRDSFGALEGVMIQIGNAVEKLTAGQAQGNFEKMLDVITKNQNVRPPSQCHRLGTESCLCELASLVSHLTN